MPDISLSDLHKKVKEVTQLKTADKYFYPYMTSTGHPIIKRLYAEAKAIAGVYKFSQLTDNQRLTFELSLMNNETLQKINDICDKILADANINAEKNEPLLPKQERPTDEKKTANLSTEQLSIF